MKIISITLLCIAILLSQGCTTKKFIISTQPEGAYIGNFFTSDVTPMEEKMTFLGKSHEYRYTLMKRGYWPDTIILTRDTPTEVNISMKRIDGVSTESTKPIELSCRNVNLLPVNVEIMLHKGVGAMDKYEHSEELSGFACTGLHEELHSIHSDTTISLIDIPDDQNWKSTSAELESYLKTLKRDLLVYYPKPASILDIVKKNEDLFSTIFKQVQCSGTNQYIVFAWCRSIKSTTGRIIGNMAVSMASPDAAVSDPSTFSIDNSTLFVAYIMDPGTGEVLDIKQHVVPYHITKRENLKEFAESIMMFPSIQP
jgi:hypothetical protein